MLKGHHIRHQYQNKIENKMLIKSKTQIKILTQTIANKALI